MSLHFKRTYGGASGSGQTFNYYISPTGSDSNDGLTTSTPWAITALWTKASTYAGHSVGVLDGTDNTSYNGTDVNGNDVAFYIPATASGSSGARTIIKAVNRHGVILTGAGGNNGAATRAAVVLYIAADYVTVEGIDCKESWAKGIYTTGANSIIIRNKVHAVDQATYYPGYSVPGDNVIGIRTDAGATNCYIGHNQVYNIRNGSRTHNEACIQLYNSASAIVECNDCSDATTGIYPKEAASGSVARYNYIHGCIDVFVYGTNDAFQWNVDHNVATGWTNLVFNDESNNIEIATSLWNNNTLVMTEACQAGVLFRATSGNPVNFYNNILARSGGAPSSSYLDMNGSAGAFNILDYNLYGASNSWSSPNGTTRTFAAWKSTTGKDAGAINANPTFASGGAGPYVYKLDPTSRGYQEGHVGGVSGGALCNMGAFESSGQTEQLGPDWLWVA